MWNALLLYVESDQTIRSFDESMVIVLIVVFMGLSQVAQVSFRFFVIVPSGTNPGVGVGVGIATVAFALPASEFPMAVLPLVCCEVALLTAGLKRDQALTAIRMMRSAAIIAIYLLCLPPPASPWPVVDNGLCGKLAGWVGETDEGGGCDGDEEEAGRVAFT